MAMSLNRAALTGAAWVLTIAVAGADLAQERSRTQGLKETDRFVKAGRTTSQAITDGKLQLQKTLDAYNGLVTQPSKDMKGDYKRLLKAMDSMNTKVGDARQKIDAMQKNADVYFTGRAETIKNIQDASLQSQAQQRLKTNQDEFAGVLESLRDAGAALEPFRKQLADQITYLGSDLTPSAMTSLKPQAEKLNAQGTEVFAKTDQALAKADSYFQGLRAET
jgi:signal transduction protein with GAF and PtsI domain